MKKILLSLSCAAALFGNDTMQSQIDALKAEVETLKRSQQQSESSLIEEVATLKESIFAPGEQYESFSSMGEAASKVYHSRGSVSIGGYGEYKYKKYTEFKNYASDSANETRRKGEYNIVRFVPYIGFKFNDWIVMNTEIEFEDGGARSDDTKNYKYAIVEFSYLDFLFDPALSLRVGHILVPMGLTNLNHEPVAYLTSERPAVETFIIPSTWHTNGALMHGRIDALEYYAGVITAPDAGGFSEGRFIQQGRLGARQFTDDLGFVGRIQYAFGEGLDAGASVYYGNSSVAKEVKPGDTTGLSGNVTVGVGMAEAHVTYNNHGFNISALAVAGMMDDEAENLPQGAQSQSVNGQYLTVGYNLLPSETQRLFVVGEIERLDMDADGITEYPDNNRFFDYTAGVAYYPDVKVALKADYMVRDYGADAKLADEEVITLSAGFIF